MIAHIMLQATVRLYSVASAAAVPGIPLQKSIAKSHHLHRRRDVRACAHTPACYASACARLRLRNIAYQLNLPNLFFPPQTR